MLLPIQFQLRRAIGAALLTALFAIAIGPETGAAQATLRGRVIDSELGQPLGGAIVKIQPGAPPRTTDSLGLFEAQGLSGGEVDVTIQAIGFSQGEFTVRLPASGMVEGVFPLDFTGYQLAEVAVVARVEQLAPRYLDFERRRRTGQGAYLRWEEIAQKGYGSVSDALRTIRGVRIQCRQQSYECLPVMARTPQCQPTWWIDGVEVRSFHESTPIRDVYGIEVYRGAGEIPGEFAGSDAGCGVIVVWTKSRPYR